jgi:hypothetical protein
MSSSARAAGRHPERKSRDPVEATVQIPQRDPSTALGMTDVAKNRGERS